MDTRRKTFSGKHSEITQNNIGAFFEVHKVLGFGFSEKVYENALVIAHNAKGLKIEQQHPIKVNFSGKIVGDDIADLFVNTQVLVEQKSAKSLNDQHEAQLLNYLKATEIKVGLLLNFGPKGEFKRKVFDNNHKGSLSWTQPK